MKQARIVVLANDANLPLHTYLYLRARGMTHRQCKLPQVPATLSPSAIVSSVTHNSCIIQTGRPGLAKRIADAKYPLMPSKRTRRVTFTCGNPLCINPNHIIYEFTQADAREVKRAALYLSYAELAKRYYLSERLIKDIIYYS